MNRDCWARVFAWVDEPAAAARLRAVASPLRDAFDGAVHFGWIGAAGHDRGAAADEGQGVTGMWARGWFPVPLEAFTHLAPATKTSLLTSHGQASGSADNSDSDTHAGRGVAEPDVVVRVEHRLFPRYVSDRYKPTRDAPRRRWYAPAVILAETAQPEPGATALDTPIAAACSSPDVRLRVAPTTTRIRLCFSIASVTSLDTAGMTSITAIGLSFFEDCKTLTSVDTSGMTAVTSIDGRFLSSCERLTSVNLAGLTAVRDVGSNFLARCGQLQHVETAGALAAVTSIGQGFLSMCGSLTSVDLSGMNSVGALGSRFLFGCSELVSVQTFPGADVGSVSPTAPASVLWLPAHGHVSDGFMYQCRELRGALTALAPTSCAGAVGGGIRTLGNYFLADAYKVTSIDTSGLSNVTDIGSDFLSLTGLTNVDTSGLRSVTRIGRAAFSRSANLHTLDTSNLTSLTDIGVDFMAFTPAAETEAVVALLADADRRRMQL